MHISASSLYRGSAWKVSRRTAANGSLPLIAIRISTLFSTAFTRVLNITAPSQASAYAAVPRGSSWIGPASR